MKNIAFIGWGLLLLAGCGSNEPDLDKEKTQNAIASRALEQKVIEEGGYTSKDIKLVKACEAIENGKSEFKGNYIVSWKTTDDKYNRTFLLKDYKVSNGDINFKEDPDRCIEY
ncbi:hypothetical protein [Fictibacillus terranigra]|uniref:DUF3862 domain-containing protein n=1 Tax=Fictibacillus terranigra TaxID=3058424 RepID=A0ABT8E4U8_9BACL|nr:hypothetical protein [Fictibacillus sp. CENA-BCM004]MDN4072909.1 hypothetical protein [Fictibacillus sp. CENA-BCM004]